MGILNDILDFFKGIKELCSSGINFDVQVDSWYINDLANPEPEFWRETDISNRKNICCYAFRISFINKSSQKLAVSNILIEYNGHSIPFSCEREMLLRREMKIKNDLKYVNEVVTEKIPFTIESINTFGGYFCVWDLPEPEYIKSNALITLNIITHRGSIKKDVILPYKMSFKDFYENCHIPN